MTEIVSFMYQMGKYADPNLIEMMGIVAGMTLFGVAGAAKVISQELSLKEYFRSLTLREREEYLQRLGPLNRRMTENILRNCIVALKGASNISHLLFVLYK